MKRISINILKLLLIPLSLVSLLIQLAVVVTASESAQSIPEYAHLQWPYAVGLVLAIACLQVALLPLMQLLSMVKVGKIFTKQALRSVDILIGCIMAATLLTSTVLIHAFIVALREGGPPIFVFAWFMVLVAGSALTLLMIVMRNLLELATNNQDELKAVI